MFFGIVMLVITIWVLGFAIAFVHAHIFGIVLFLIATGLVLFVLMLARTYICGAIEIGIWIYKKIKKIPETDENRISRYTWRSTHSDSYIAEIEEKVKKTKERKNSRYY